MNGGSSTDTPRSTEEVAAVLNRVIARVGDSTSDVDWYERLLAALDAKDAEIQRLREARENVSLIRGAVADPGCYTPRGDNYGESLPNWQARAVVIALSLSDTPGEQ